MFDTILEAPMASGAGDPTLQMVDGTVIPLPGSACRHAREKAMQHSAGAGKGASFECLAPIPWRGLNRELPVQVVGSNHGRPLATPSRGALSVDPGRDARKTGQPRHPVLGSLFSLIAQIVDQLAAAVDLAAVAPSLTETQSGATVEKAGFNLRNVDYL